MVALLGWMTITASAETKFIEPALEIKQFKVPAGFKTELWAEEPQLANPVAMCIDEHGKVYVTETYRLIDGGVYDIRNHMDLYSEDLACRTIEDRLAMIQKHYGVAPVEFTKASEKVQLLEDRSGGGKADFATTFAEGFNEILDGLGAGVLARKGDVYFTDIPNLWRLRDTNGNGKADVRELMSRGYGVHFGYSGHDLHGLRIGPDGKMYFTMADRGLHLTTREGRVLDYPDTGTVLRCNLDGSELEVFAYGLRNPQKLAFDDYGNLFTGDNNCDYGDAARLVYIVEGGDSGWRIANQFSDTTPAGVWNSEKLWHLQFPGQAAYIVPPVGHIASGPSGLAHYPGTGFSPAYRDHFFLCDFRGSGPNSGIHGFAVKPDGAGFDMVDHTEFFWGILATDAEFGPDGRMYACDWVDGWAHQQQGRIFRVSETNYVNSPEVLQTKQLIGEGMEKRSNKELAKLLEHSDQRVRQEAQFELAARGSKAVSTLRETARHDTNQLARLHGIWGLGQISVKDPRVLKDIVGLLQDRDAEVRAQTAKVLGNVKFTAATGPLIKALKDENARARFFAAISLSKLGDHAAIPALVDMLRRNEDRDVYIRHAAVMGLTGLAGEADLTTLAKDNSRSVRMGALLAMRRQRLPEVATFLHDGDELIVLEAARAINDLTMTNAMPQLATLIAHPTMDEMLDWRVINANFRIGKSGNAVALANYAVRTDATEKVRVEALHALETWASPSPRDRITGLWLPLASRDGKAAADALRPVASQLLSEGPDGVRLASIQAVEKLSVTEAGPALFTIAGDHKTSSDVRVEALKALGELHDAHLADAVNLAVNDNDEKVRKEGNELRAQMKPGDATGQLAQVLEKGSIGEKQGAFATLGGLPGEAADKLISDWLDKLIASNVEKEVKFDLIFAAEKRTSPEVKAKLKQYEDAQPKTDEFLGFRETLYGGDAEAGRKIFMEKPEASCVRCHKVRGDGGQVGPELTGIITRHDREYILESILFPNKQIAAGFESVLVEMNDGQAYAGIVKGQDDKELTLLAVEDGQVMKLKKSDIKKQVKGLSPMPEGMGNVLSKQDLRNLVEFLATLK
jgi:quinoprotein glucose dehydrogenase